MATGTLLYFPKQSKPTPKPKKKPGQKCSVLEWICSGYVFPCKPAPSGKGGVR